MTRNEILKAIEKTGIIAVIRLADTSKLYSIIEALSAGGIGAMEITMTTPGAVNIIKELSEAPAGDFILGAGTVLSASETRQVIAAGAQFVVSPICDSGMISEAHQHDRPIFPGAYTPSEVWHAWTSGADVVKVFPATVLGPGYFKDIHGPFPEIKLTPTGGVSLNNATDFVRAGACFLGVGTALLDKAMIAASDWGSLTDLARKFAEAVANGRD